jgi:hypothetical protein
MKKALGTIAVALAMITGLAQAQKAAQTQTKKLGDAYATAALRVLIAGTTSQEGINEMEAQISSATEQKSFDEIKPILEGDMLIQNFYDKAAETARLLGSESQTAASFAQHIADRKPCWDALKTNLKRRDGTIPKECKAQAPAQSSK